MKLTSTIFFSLILSLITGCRSENRQEVRKESHNGKMVAVNYASGFSIKDFGEYRILEVENPWPNSDKAFKYLLYKAGAEIPKSLSFDEKIQIPVKRIVVTSTTHLPSLEALNEVNSLIGFPGLQYISSKKTRERIAEGKVQEVGKNEALNTEILLNLKPDVLVGFAVEGSNRTFSTLTRSGIPVVYNADWTETSPLGKAEWIKFFGAFFDRSTEAAAYFEQVSSAYIKARELAKTSEKKPTVLAGAMYKDQWYLPTGDSWHGRFFEDANANYLFEETSGTGSLSLSFEAVLARARDADFWIGPAQFGSYQEMKNASAHYSEFSAFQKKNIYTFSSEKGETGGVLFYEMAPNRPDIVLKDLISIFHPELLPGHETKFYKPLE